MLLRLLIGLIDLGHLLPKFQNISLIQMPNLPIPLFVFKKLLNLLSERDGNLLFLKQLFLKLLINFSKLFNLKLTRHNLLIPFFYLIFHIANRSDHLVDLLYFGLVGSGDLNQSGLGLLGGHC